MFWCISQIRASTLSKVDSTDNKLQIALQLSPTRRIMMEKRSETCGRLRIRRNIGDSRDTGVSQFTEPI